MLVKEVEVNEPDEGTDGEWYDYYVTQYKIPDGSYCYAFEDVVKHTIDWLNSERKE